MRSAEMTVSFSRFEVEAKLILTSSKFLTKEEKIEATLLVEQHLNSLSPIFLDALKARMSLRVHIGPISKIQMES